MAIETLGAALRRISDLFAAGVAGDSPTRDSSSDSSPRQTPEPSRRWWGGMDRWS